MRSDALQTRDRYGLRPWNGPGSAVHRSALTRSTLHRVRDTCACGVVTRKNCLLFLCLRLGVHFQPALSRQPGLEHPTRAATDRYATAFRRVANW
jgi:hypothetical protein